MPDCLLQMISLETLQLAGNGLRGDISKFDMPRVNVFSISGNKFRGELPSSIKNKSFEVFDISNNQITGYLDMDISSASPANSSADTDVSASSDGTTTFRADVNRLSGRLNLDPISTFNDVSVLDGNLFSCKSLPSFDKGYSDYKCGSFNLEVSLYIWMGVGVLAGVILINVVYLEMFESYRLALFDFYKDFTNERVDQDAILSASGMEVGHMRQLLRTLGRLQCFALIFVGFILVATVPVYVGLKYGGDESYKVYAEQYAHVVSALYLRSRDPAVTMFTVYVCCYLLLTYGVFRLFVMEWSIMRNYVKHKAIDDHTTVNMSTLRLFTYRATKAVITLLYLCVMFSINAVYVKMTVEASDVTLLLLQVGIFVINAVCREFGIYYLVHYVFDGSDVLSSRASIVYSVLLLTTDFLIPAMATLATDDLCLAQYPEANRQEVTSSYEYVLCTLTSYYGNICEEYTTSTSTSTFKPPFIYSNHCRDALYRNYIPIIILSCVWNTFLSPIMYCWLTWSATSVSEAFCVCGLKLYDMGELVLPNLSILMIYICEDFCLLLLYGIVSPYCAVALGIVLLVRIFMTKGGILRYYKLQRSAQAVTKGDRGDDGSLKDEHELKKEETTAMKKDINFMCSQARRNTVHVIWPGLFLSTYCFALFLFDMAHDNDDDSLTASYCLIVAMVVVVHTTRVVYYHYKHKLHLEVIERVEGQGEIDAHDNINLDININGRDDRMMSVQTREDGTMQSLTNPLLSADHGHGV